MHSSNLSIELQINPLASENVSRSVDAKSRVITLFVSLIEQLMMSEISTKYQARKHEQLHFFRMHFEWAYEQTYRRRSNQ
jgi:hypothetical protein